VEVVGRQAVAVQLRLAQRSQKGQVIGRGMKYGSAVVAPVQGMIKQAVSDGSWKARHRDSIAPDRSTRQRKNELTPFIPHLFLSDGSWKARHRDSIAPDRSTRQRKNELTPFIQTRPARVLGRPHQPRPQRISLDVAADRQEMIVGLDRE
jgi:hypothetical protein